VQTPIKGGSSFVIEGRRVYVIKKSGATVATYTSDKIHVLTEKAV
jgi:hypothetical protein